MIKNFNVAVYCVNMYRVNAETEEEAMKIARAYNDKMLDAAEFDYNDTCTIEYMETNKVSVSE